ncbi:MAG: hypothetical protein HS111_16925 [Kofleriaceae bacterium]|nr:hypothetical protein [Kofleriaceae bacterium]
MKRKLASLLAFLAFAGLAPTSTALAATLYTTTVLEDKPVAYWSFDEADGNATQQAPVAAASVTTENDLIPNGTASRVSHASLGTGLRLGQAADFTGSGFFRAPALRAGQLTLDGAWAIELWFQSQAENAATYLANFGPTGGDNSPAVIYGFNPEYLEIFAGGGGRTGTTGPALNDQSWHHLLFVYYGDGTDGVAARLDAYLDGNAFPYLSPDSPVSKRLSLASLIVGAALSGGQNAFTGRIDEFAVYDLSHLPDETAIETHVTQLVSTHMASATATSGEPYASVVLSHQPRLYWSFDEAEGSAKQLAPISFPTPDNTLNDLVVAGNATRVTHSAIASGLQLGNAIDLDGTSSFQRVGGLDVGRQTLPSPWILELWFQFTGDQANRYLLNMGRGGYYNSPAVIYGYFGPRLEVFGNGRSSTLGPEVNDRNWHHLVVVNYNTAPSGADPANRVDFFIDNVQYPNVGGGFTQPVDFADWLIFGAALPAGDGGLIGRLDELAIYSLNDLTTVEAIEARAADLAADELERDGSRGVRYLAHAGRFGFAYDRDRNLVEDRRGQPLAGVLAELDRTIAEQRSVITDRTRTLMDTLVMGELARQLQGQVHHLDTTVKGINRVLRGLRFGPSEYQFLVTPRPDRAELIELVRRLSILDEDSRVQFRAWIDARLDELHATDDGPPPLLDYRRWFEVKLRMSTTDAEGVELTHRLRQVGSGGEQGVPNYLLVLALAKLMFDAGGAAIRPLLFDEAFYGIDAGRRDQLLRLATDLGLQLLVASPDQDGVTEAVRAATTLFVVKDADHDVHLAPYHYWNRAREPQAELFAPPPATGEDATCRT